ncbi:hypothetical protein D3C80_1569120 [compost metagenome]
MIRSLLIGLVAGQRSMTPLAATALSAASGRIAVGHGLPSLLSRPLVAAVSAVLAAGELAGDKMASAPDRTVLLGLVARLITGALAGAAVAPAKNRPVAASLGALGAVAGGYAGLALRKRAMRRYGQMRSGVVEDVLTLGATALLFRPALQRPQAACPKPNLKTKGTAHAPRRKIRLHRQAGTQG